MTRCPHDVDERACAPCTGRTRSGRPPRTGTFVARYNGVCTACGFDLRAGDPAAYVDDRLVHGDCR